MGLNFEKHNISSRRIDGIGSSALSVDRYSLIYSCRVTEENFSSTASPKPDFTCEEPYPSGINDFTSISDSSETFDNIFIGLNKAEYDTGISGEGYGKTTKYYPISDKFNIGLYGADSGFPNKDFVYAIAKYKDTDKGLEEDHVVTTFEKTGNFHVIPGVTTDDDQDVYGFGRYCLVKEYTKLTTRTLRTTVKEGDKVVSVSEREI